MSKSTSKTGTTGKATSASSTSNTIRRGLRTGEHVVSLQFGAWGPQEVIVRAYSDGGRGGAPYIVVGVGTCLTYAYDQAAVDSYVLAWEAVERLNRTVRLPEFTPTSATRRHAGRTCRSCAT